MGVEVASSCLLRFSALLQTMRVEALLKLLICSLFFLKKKSSSAGRGQGEIQGCTNPPTPSTAFPSSPASSTFVPPLKEAGGGLVILGSHGGGFLCSVFTVYPSRHQWVCKILPEERKCN